MEIGISEGFSRENFDRKVSVAPMMDWTDRHCRYFLRGFSPRMLLYTEMVTAAAIVRGDRERLLRHSPEEQPLALQLGGSDAGQLAVAARIGADSGYVEINLNCGCPSDRVHAGAFGACLMREPARVADCVAAMRTAVPAHIPVTVKMRIGVLDAVQRSAVDRYEDADYENLQHFVRAVQGAGCRHFIVHARQAVLGGLSPRENREIPPLRYDVVRRLKQEFPSLWIAVNGGLRDIGQCRAALDWADGIMLGREAYHRPQVLGELHAELYPDGWRVPQLPALLERMAAYAARESALGTPLRAITRHMLGLASGRPGARRFRQLLAQPPARFPLRQAAEALVAGGLATG
ncbi:MAG TPA: tRNA dihydrouridine(20/20a) synthase DusA [Steroidobacteraceae bacterium]|nr:tRNA dihydrouridine(20/20a) synthase DusA [Steroidobacteraceae bacterium]